MAIYWIALPFVALGTAGLSWLLLAPNAPQPAGGTMPLWVSWAVSAVLTLLLVWRLWMHGRARRIANEVERAPASPDGRGVEKTT